MTVFKNSKADVLKPTQEFQGGLPVTPSYVDDAAAEAAFEGAIVNGAFYMNSTSNNLKVRLNGAWETVTSS